jgi:hypothetical protein
MQINEEVTYERVPVAENPYADEFVPIRREVTLNALRVTSLEADMRRRGSDRLMNLRPVYEADDRLFNVCDVLPQDPTPAQLDDLAVRLSNFLEDAHRCSVDHDGVGDFGQLAPVMSLPIVHREKLRAAEQNALVLSGADFVAAVALQHSEACLFHGVTERETICMLYLQVPQWSEPSRTQGDKVLERRVWSRVEQLAELDRAARRHGLRCLEIGVIPSVDG